MIFVIRLTDEQRKALRSRLTWPRMRSALEDQIRIIANRWIEENKEDQIGGIGRNEQYKKRV